MSNSDLTERPVFLFAKSGNLMRRLICHTSLLSQNLSSCMRVELLWGQGGFVPFLVALILALRPPSPAVLSLLPPGPQAPKLLFYQPQAAAGRCRIHLGSPCSSLPHVLRSTWLPPGFLQCPAYLCVSKHPRCECV